MMPRGQQNQGKRFLCCKSSGLCVSPYHQLWGAERPELRVAEDQQGKGRTVENKTGQAVAKEGPTRGKKCILSKDEKAGEDDEQSRQMVG